MMRFVAFVMIGVSCVTPLWAAPLDRKELPADVRWFVHIDLEALNANAIGRELASAGLSHPQFKQGVENFQRVTGTDPLTEVYGVTICNTSFTPDQAIIIVHAKLNPQQLEQTAASLPAHVSQQYEKYVLHSWKDANSGKNSFGAIVNPQTLVLASTQKGVEDEVAALNGNGHRNWPSSDPLPQGTCVVAGARGICDANELAIQSPALKNSRQLLITVGESDGQVSLHAQLTAVSAEKAEQVRSVLDGVRAMVQLQNNQDSQKTKLLAALKVKADDATVRVDWSAPTADIVAFIRSQGNAQVGVAPPQQ